MKKILLGISLVSVVVLGGCFEAAQNNPSASVSQPGTQSPAAASNNSTSSQDSDAYFKAQQSHDPKDCATIQNKDLKAKCEENAKSSSFGSSGDQAYFLKAHTTMKMEFCTKILDSKMKSQCESDLTSPPK